MTGRLNNLSARLAANSWLKANGHDPVDQDAPYTVFATRLRRIAAPRMKQVPFTHRPDAVAYIRDFASHLESADYEPLEKVTAANLKPNSHTETAG